MKNHTPLIIAALIVSIFTGCSKHTQTATPLAPAKPIAVTLGVVEVSDGVSSRHDIGDGRVCIIKPTILKDGSVRLAITVNETNSSAERFVSSLGVETLPDEAVEMENGVISVSLKPHIKK